VEKVFHTALSKGSLTWDTVSQPSTVRTTTLLSSLCEAMYLPTGSHTTPLTKEVCSCSTVISVPLTASQILTVLSRLQEATIVSSRHQAKSTTLFEWPVSVLHSAQFSTFLWDWDPKLALEEN